MIGSFPSLDHGDKIVLLECIRALRKFLLARGSEIFYRTTPNVREPGIIDDFVGIDTRLKASQAYHGL